MSETSHPIGCVIMASGLARRFGSNKLLADFGGRPLLCRALDATDTPQLACRIVVTRSAEVETLCQTLGVACLRHALPGRNDTVRLGLEALLTLQPGLAGCIFLPGDQPLLRRESVAELADRWRRSRRWCAPLWPTPGHKKKQSGQSSGWRSRPKTTRNRLSEAPFCLDAVIFPPCAPYLKAKAAVCCSGVTRSGSAMCSPQTVQSFWTRTHRRPCGN